MKSFLLLICLVASVIGGSVVDLQFKHLKKIFPPISKGTLLKMLGELNSAANQTQVCKSFNSSNYWKTDKQKMNIRAAANCVAWVKNHAKTKKQVDAVFAALPRNKTTTAYKAAELKTLWWKKYRNTNVDAILAFDKFFDEYESLRFTKQENLLDWDYFNTRRVIQDERFRELKASDRVMWYAWERDFKNS